jgi:hypothetical protein
VLINQNHFFYSRYSSIRAIRVKSFPGATNEI